MTIEEGVFTLLSGSAPVAAALDVPLANLPSHIFRSGAVVDPPNRFLIIRWDSPLIAALPLALPTMTLRAHDRDRTYDRVDAALDAAKGLLTAVVHQYGITQVDWRGRSPDLADDGYGTLTRFDTYNVAGGLTAREEV